MNPKKPPPCRLLGLSPAPVSRVAWGVVSLASGRMSYLQHGLLAPSVPPDEILRGYNPAAVAVLAEDPAEAGRLTAAARAALGSGARGPATLSYRRANLERALGSDPEAAVVALLALPQCPQPLPACSALAAAAAAAMGGLPGSGPGPGPKTAGAVVPFPVDRLAPPRGAARGRRNVLPF